MMQIAFVFIRKYKIIQDQNERRLIIIKSLDKIPELNEDRFSNKTYSGKARRVPSLSSSRECILSRVRRKSDVPIPQT